MSAPSRPARRDALRTLAHGAGAGAALVSSPHRAALAADAAPAVHLYVSEATRAYVRAQGGDPSVFEAPWRASLQRAGLRVVDADARRLAGLRGSAVLVLPSVLLLDDDEREAIDAFVRRGGGVLATWATGARDGQGRWRGFDWLARRFDATVVEPLAGDSEEWFLLPYGDTPPTRRLRAGERLWLTKVAESPLRVTGGVPIARFGDWARLTLQPRSRAAAATLSERDGGRTVYLGFAETSWSASQPAIDRLVADAIGWLARIPTASLAAWPGTHRSAFVVEMDTEDRFENARWFAELLEREDLRGTFYCLTSEARRHPALVAALAARHEIAYHGDVHVGFADLPEAAQRARLDAMIAEMRPLLPAGAGAPRGFRAPLESYDATTERLLRAAGLGHHAASPGSREDVLPGFSRAEDGVPPDAALVVLPRTMLDDVNWLKLGILERSVREPMLAAYDDSVSMRGLGLLSVHSQNFAPGGVLHTELPALLQALARDRARVWTATGGQVERWWRDRAAVALETERPAADALRLRVAAARAVPAGVRIDVHPGASDAVPELVGEGGGVRLERLDALAWAVLLPALPAGRRTIELRFRR